MWSCMLQKYINRLCIFFGCLFCYKTIFVISLQKIYSVVFRIFIDFSATFSIFGFSHIHLKKKRSKNMFFDLPKTKHFPKPRFLQKLQKIQIWKQNEMIFWKVLNYRSILVCYFGRLGYGFVICFDLWHFRLWSRFALRTGLRPLFGQLVSQSRWAKRANLFDEL